jgi:hypothetical protein
MLGFARLDVGAGSGSFLPASIPCQSNSQPASRRHALAHGYRMAFLLSSGLLFAAAAIARSRVPRASGPPPRCARRGSLPGRLTRRTGAGAPRPLADLPEATHIN